MLTLFTVPLFALFILSSPSTAQEAEPQQATKQETAEEQEEEKKPPRFYWDNGLWFRARRANFRVKIGGQAQNDTAGFASNGTQPVELEGGVEWRRARVYALRQRASLFGHNAPDPRMFPELDTTLVDTNDTSLWDGFQLQGGKIDLDTVQPKVVAGSWVVLAPNSGAAIHFANRLNLRNRAMAVSSSSPFITPGPRGRVGEPSDSRKMVSAPLGCCLVAFVYSSALSSASNKSVPPSAGSSMNHAMPSRLFAGVARTIAGGLLHCCAVLLKKMIANLTFGAIRRIVRAS